MLYYAVVFLIIAIIAGFFGFIGVAGLAASIAKILFVVFIILFILSLIFGRRRLRSTPRRHPQTGRRGTYGVVFAAHAGSRVEPAADPRRFFAAGQGCP